MALALGFQFWLKTLSLTWLGLQEVCENLSVNDTKKTKDTTGRHALFGHSVLLLEGCRSGAGGGVLAKAHVELYSSLLAN